MDAERTDVELLRYFDTSFNPPHQCGDDRCRDFFLDFIYIVVIPAAVVLLIVFIIIFSVLVCCCVKRKKKPEPLSEDQLATYEAVRRASISVRRMSQSNSTPLLDDASRSGSMSLVRNDHRRRGFRPRDSCHSAPGTLQRQHRNRDSSTCQDTPPPPPYGGPPQYPLADEEQAFLGPDIQLQEFPADDPEDRQNDQQHPARHHHHHRRQRPYSAANGYMTR